jgi:hypothetical protein
MAITGATTAKLPACATITIREQMPNPSGEVEVTPDGGRVHFENKDKEEWRLRFWKPDTDPNAGIDILLPAGERISVVIKEKDVFLYSVMNFRDADDIKTGGGGPIRN